MSAERAADEAEKRAMAALGSARGSMLMRGFDEWMRLSPEERDEHMRQRTTQPIIASLGDDALRGRP